jgi:hypothetical protein
MDSQLIIASFLWRPHILPESKPLPSGGASPHVPSALYMRPPYAVSKLPTVCSPLLLRLPPSIGVDAPPG